MNEHDRAQQQQRMAWVRKNAWSRERIEDLRALGLTHLDGDELNELEDACEFMLRVRQAVRGGRLHVRGSARHWNDVADEELG